MTTSSVITDNSTRQRFELDVAGGKAFIDYLRDGSVLTLAYAEVPAHLRGGGVGAALVEGTLALVRQRGEKVVPQCSFVAAYIAGHPQAQDLLADRPPAR